MFKVEKGIAIPSKKASNEKYPFKAMKPGDSFAFPAELWGKVRSAAYAHAYKHNCKFRVSKESLRCWRIA